MIAKLAVAGVLTLGMLPLPDSEFPPTIWTHHPYIEKVQCSRGSGTAFKISDGRWLTVAHVTRIGGCSIDGIPINETYVDHAGDFSVIEVPGDNRRGGIEVNCEGFKDREWYFGEGHGRGSIFPQVVSVRYSTVLTAIGGLGKWGVLEANRFVPGMSGGVVLDQTGRAVGMVNAYGIFQRISFSRQLRDTVICQNSGSARP